MLAKIEAAFGEALKSDSVQQTLQSRLMTTFGWTGSKADEQVRKSERAWSWTLADLGIAEVSPEDLGITRP